MTLALSPRGCPCVAPGLSLVPVPLLLGSWGRFGHPPLPSPSPGLSYGTCVAGAGESGKAAVPWAPSLPDGAGAVASLVEPPPDLIFSFFFFFW